MLYGNDGRDWSCIKENNELKMIESGMGEICLESEINKEWGYLLASYMFMPPYTHNLEEA